VIEKQGIRLIKLAGYPALFFKRFSRGTTEGKMRWKKVMQKRKKFPAGEHLRLQVNN
jgi:hypothetical protein